MNRTLKIKTKISKEVIDFFKNFNVLKDNEGNTYYSFEGVIVERINKDVEIYTDKLDLMIDERSMAEKRIKI